MSVTTVRRNLVKRLEELDRGDRGWFVITRVHVGLAWLKGIAEYLNHRGRGGVIWLDDTDYDRMATITEITSQNPGVQLRRHHLLVMDKPLQLLQRVDGNRWGRVLLTENGRALAVSDDPSHVLEKSLSAIRFAVDPWAPSSRINQYRGFDIYVYEVMKQLLTNCGGSIDRDEFDFFVSRIRVPREVSWAVDAIAEFRTLSNHEKASLHEEVRNRLPSEKAYSNWRDVGLHTFSLFSLGTSMIREGQRLLLTDDWVEERELSTSSTTAAESQLRMPEPPEIEELLIPPAAPASNDGANAESFVAKVLRSQDWTVAFYTNRRGYGFDLWARKEKRAMVIEVKSSLEVLGGVTLTATEYKAASEHGDSYVLALVENMKGDSPRLRMIQNPVATLQIEKRQDTSYVIPRAEWVRTAEIHP